MASATIRQQILEVLSDPMNLPAEFWQYDVQNWVKEAPVFPVSQVFGFLGFVFQPATTIATAETTASTSFTDLATVGPSLTNLADGQYAIFYGAQLVNPATGTAAASVQVNSTGATAADDIVVSADAVINISTSRLLLKTLSSGNANSLTMKYIAAGGTATFAARWMTAIKYQNL